MDLLTGPSDWSKYLLLALEEAIIEMGVPSCFHHQHAEINSTSAYFVIMTELTLSQSGFGPTGHGCGFDASGNFFVRDPGRLHVSGASVDVRIDPDAADECGEGKEEDVLWSDEAKADSHAVM